MYAWWQEQKPRALHALPEAATSARRYAPVGPSALESTGKRRLALQAQVLHLEHVLHQVRVSLMLPRRPSPGPLCIWQNSSMMRNAPQNCAHAQSKSHAVQPAPERGELIGAGAQEQEENEVKELEQRLEAQLARVQQASAERKQRQEEAQQDQAARRKKARLRRQVQALRARLLAQVAHLELAQKAGGATRAGAALSPSAHAPSAAAEAAAPAAPVPSKAPTAAAGQLDERVKRETHVLHTLQQQAQAAEQRAARLSRRAAAEARLLSRSQQQEQRQQAGAAQRPVENGVLAAPHAAARPPSLVADQVSNDLRTSDVLPTDCLSNEGRVLPMT